jgi:hypothetical protein
VSEIQLDMGARVPIAELPQDQPVNGQGPYVSWTIELPVRNDDGTLAITSRVRSVFDRTHIYG